MNKRFEDQIDENIRESLLKETTPSPELKDEIWNQIERRIVEDEINQGNNDHVGHVDGNKFENQKMEGNKKMRTEKRSRKNSKKRLFGIGTVAAALLIVFFAGTAPGHAAIDRIREFFAPEKTITEELEGIQEEKNVNLQKSKLGYVIYFDEEMFEMNTVDGVDRIAPKTQADYLPEVYMEVQQIEDKDMNTIAADLEKEMKEEFEIFINDGKVQQPIEGIRLLGQKGNQWDDVVLRYYIVDNTEGGAFIIKQQFFVEAFEGFGARFDNILKEFHIVELEN